MRINQIIYSYLVILIMQLLNASNPQGPYAVYMRGQSGFNSWGCICYSRWALFSGSSGKETGTFQAAATSITGLILLELVLLENVQRQANKLIKRGRELKLKIYLFIALANLELCTLGLDGQEGRCDRGIATWLCVCSAHQANQSFHTHKK